MNNQRLSFSSFILSRLCAVRITLSLVFMALIASVDAQTLTFPLNNGFNATVSGLSPTICQPSAAASAGNFLYFSSPVFPFILNGTSTGINLYSNNEAGYHIARAGDTAQIIVDIPTAGGLALNDQINYNYGQFDGPPTPQKSSVAQYIPPTGGNPYGVNRHVLKFAFPLGIRKGYLAFKVVDGAPWPTHMCVIPFVVEGATVAQVDSLGTTVQPQMPFMVLHAPPGDGSFSEFQENKTTCREFQDRYAEDGSNSANLAVKLGAKGSLGLIAMVDYEFSVTFSGGVTVGDMAIKTSSKQTCISASKTFSTTTITGPDGDGDVFIGYGTDLAYGVYPFIVADAAVCGSRLDTGLVYAPVGIPRRFSYTKSAILSNITQLEAIVADSAVVGAKAANDAQNQIDVWQQVLTMNQQNVDNPSNQLIEVLSFSAGSSETQQSAITILETNSIEVEHYIEGTVGVQAVVEVGGSGVSGGYEYKGSKRFGQTQNQSTEISKVVGYTLTDDDNDGNGDHFNLDVVRDPMFGTPIFRITSGTQSSCPYQGGYQRDQPVLKHNNTTNTHILSQGNPVGGASTFLLDLCNDSNEPRTYRLKLNPASNPNGAVVSAAGVPLNSNDLGQSYTVPAGSCLQDILVNVSMLNASSPLEYPNLELCFYSDCEDEIYSCVSASVFFGTATSIEEDLQTIDQVVLFPNPASQTATLTFDLLQAGTVGVEIYDLAGRRCMRQDATPRQAGPQRWEFPVHSLAEGIYTVHILSNQGAYAPQKLVVRR